MSADARGIRTNPIQELFWTRTGLLLLILVVTAGTCLTISSGMESGTLKNVLGSVGTGTLISAVVSFWQTIITSAAAQRALVAPVVEESRRALRNLSAEYRALDREFFPSDVFEPTATPDPAFNQKLMADLERTRLYCFRGFSGRYAACRMLLAHSECEVRVVLADPRDDEAISGRARYTLRNEGVESNYGSVQARLKDEIGIGLVGLYLARARSRLIDVTVVPDPPLERLELFDDSCWLSLYSNTSAGVVRLHPRTLRFTEGSFVYGVERAEFLRISSSRYGQHFTIHPNTSTDDFFALYEKITGSPLDEKRFHTLENKFHTFRLEFSRAAQLRS